MKKCVPGMALMLLLLSGSAGAAQTEGMNGPPEGRMNPPPEAIAVCKGKSEGASVQFTTPRGETLKGVCRNFEGVLTAMPERGAPPKSGKPDENNSGQAGN